MANNNCTPLATGHRTTELSCACPDDLGEMARLQREPRIAIIVLSDLIVPSRHSVLSGPWPQIAAHRNILAYFTPAVFHFAACARHGERPIIGRTCQLRRPAQWLRPMTCAKLIVGSEGLVGKFPTARSSDNRILWQAGRLRSGWRLLAARAVLWRRGLRRRRARVRASGASGCGAGCGCRRRERFGRRLDGGAVLVVRPSQRRERFRWRRGHASGVERVQCAGGVRAALGKGLPSHPRSDIMIEVGRWCLNRISAYFSGRSSDLPHEMSRIDKQTIGRDGPRRN